MATRSFEIELADGASTYGFDVELIIREAEIVHYLITWSELCGRRVNSVDVPEDVLKALDKQIQELPTRTLSLWEQEEQLGIEEQERYGF
jgi:hypothetical protein